MPFSFRFDSFATSCYFVSYPMLFRLTIDAFRLPIDAFGLPVDALQLPVRAFRLPVDACGCI
jgi:hypothetical protein